MVSMDRIRHMVGEALDEAANASNRLAAAKVAASNAHTRVVHLYSIVSDTKIAEAGAALDLADDQIDLAGVQLDGATVLLREFLGG